MKIKSVHINDFGPFRNCTLELADGMTVIVGDNEAGKSSWHAAIYAALCGIRRARGAPLNEDSEFEAEHRPWDGDAWSVTAELELANRHAIAIVQDLDGGPCQAFDKDLGRRDVSSDIRVEGSPDGSCWLGLNRTAFRATACVRQTEILDVIARANALQEHLQRAVTTGAADQTAANALNALDEFHRERVGTLRANSQKPLRAAQSALSQAQQSLDDAKKEHQQYLDKLAVVQRLRAEVTETEERHRLLIAADALCRANEAEQITQKAQCRITKLQHDPIDANALQAALDQVSQSIAVWKSAPASEPSDGRASAEIEQELAALSRPTGNDLVPDQSFVEAEQAWREAARRVLEAHQNERPRFEDGSAPRARISLLVIAGFLIAAGTGLGFFTTHIVTILALVVAAGLIMFAIRELAVARRRARTATLDKHKQELQNKEAGLRHALTARRVEEVHDLERAVRAYREGCETRAKIARLEEERKHARLVEGNRAKRRAEGENLLQVAHNQGLDADDPESALQALTGWQVSAKQRLEESQQQANARIELNVILNGHTHDQLAQEAMEARQRANELFAGLPLAQVNEEASQPGLEGRLNEAQKRAQETQIEKANAEGALNSLKVADISAAEEALTAKQAEWDRVQRLDRVLNKTCEFLKRAQDRVHRQFAPHLENTIRPWLPRVTAGRYISATIDPEKLTIKVRDVQGNWREAEILSQGTREQIYLLLRVAVLRFLTKPGESSPLILDAVTVHSDNGRTDAILSLLHEISREHQVIVFSHEDHVRGWSETHLDPSRDKLEPLNNPVPVPAAATKLDVINTVHS